MEPPAVFSRGWLAGDLWWLWGKWLGWSQVVQVVSEEAIAGARPKIMRVV